MAHPEGPTDDGLSHPQGATGAEPPPWAELPVEIAPVVRPHLGTVAEEIIAAIQREVPDYSRPLEGEFGVAVRRGVEVALSRLLLELPGRSEPALSPQSRQVYGALGQGEARTGRPMEALLAAYRVGARMAFRTVARIAAREGLGPALLVPLGESIFVYIDELSAASIEAFTGEQFRQAGERDRRRAVLLDQLVSGRAEESDLRTLATRAAWRVPAQVVVVVVPGAHADGLRLVVGDRGLVRRRGNHTVVLTGAPARAQGRVELEAMLAGRQSWIGPSRSWLRAASSLAAAQSALTLAAQAPGLQEGGGPWWVDDHLSDLVLHGEPELMADLARRCLAPLDELRPGQRDRLAETLLSWLGHHGERAGVARELHIHPQTVGYRVAQLRDAFGPALDDPLTRFELQLVLRAGHR